MTTSAFIGGITAKIWDGVSVLIAIEEVIDVGGVGETGAVEEATHYASAGSREFIGGLTDGNEVTIECNKVQGAATQADFKAAVKAGDTRQFEITLTDGTTAEIYTFNAVCKDWSVSPQVEGRNTISFQVKITGGITIT